MPEDQISVTRPYQVPARYTQVQVANRRIACATMPRPTQVVQAEMDGGSRTRSLCGFGVALFVAFGAVVAVPVLNVVLCVTATVVIAAAAVYLLLVSTDDGLLAVAEAPLLSEQPGAAAGARAGAAAAASAIGYLPIAEVQPATTTRKRSKHLYFLDSIKCALTALVVLHHTSGQSFGSGGGWLTLFGYRSPFLIFNAVLSLLDQCYFMCLFFFISGYFTPRSYDKKGPKAFLRDKIKRLGIPFLLYLLVIGPLMQCFIALVVAKDGGYEYKPDPGPSWFLAWLLLLNSCYCLIGGAPLVACPRPPLRNLILYYGIPLGLLQATRACCSDELPAHRRQRGHEKLEHQGRDRCHQLLFP